MIDETAIVNQVRIRNDFCIGRHSIIDDFCYVAANLKIGDFSHISANCTFLGGCSTVTIGNFVNVAPGCRFVGASHNYSFGGLNGPMIPNEFKGYSEVGDIVLHDHVLIGCNTVILPGVLLPEGVAIGALSLVKPGQYRPWTLYAGIPAREIGPRYNRKGILKQAKKCLQS